MIAAEKITVPAPEAGFFVAVGHAERDSASRLVKASKSPTRTGEGIRGPIRDAVTPPGTPGAYAVLQFREWSDEWRVRCRVEPLSVLAPPQPDGPRVTESLTLRGARKIMESCAFVAETEGGYSTFLTLTLDAEARARLDAGQTLQSEVSRFFDAMQKAYSRGMVASDPETGEPVQIEGRPLGALQYCWVAEVPDTIDTATGEVGAPNPHVHVLMRWRVPRRQFRAWAARIESIWGQGFAHLEKIKDGTAAAAYMMKAAGYLTKAQGKADQGRIRGNRYAISKPARAPDWVTVQEWQLHAMGRLIADVHQHMTEVHGEDYRLRAQLAKRLDAAPKGSQLRAAIGRKLEAVRARLKMLPVVAGKYQLLFKGQEAAIIFMSWARCRGGHQPGVSWLPRKARGEAWAPGERPESAYFDRWKLHHYWRRAVRAARKAWRFGWTDQEWGQAKQDYSIWAGIPA